jgi:putative transposase
VRKSKFTEEQIAFALKQAELGISDATFYVWRKKYDVTGWRTHA